MTRAVPLAGTDLGATPAQQPLHLTVALTPRDAAGMKAAVTRMYAPGSAGYHHYLTAAQWRSRYAPSSAAVAQVTDYLRREGLTHIDVAANRLAVSAEATAAVAERAFHTSLRTHLVQGQKIFGNTAPAQVPSALHPTVNTVLGLNDVPLDAVKTQVVHPGSARAAGSPSTAGLFPHQFRMTYDANGTATGARTAIAVMSEGVTAPVISSLRYAEKVEKQPRVPVTVVQAGAQSQDAAGIDEFAMDTQASTLFAGRGQASVHVQHRRPDRLPDHLRPREVRLRRQGRGPLGQSGRLRVQRLPRRVRTDCRHRLQEAALQGQSFFAGSGDEGDACAFLANTGTPVGVPQDEWPAVGEFDLAVGGTSLISDDRGNRIQELAWLGGGGGDSEFELPGPWTQDTNPGYDSEFVTGGRAVPDVALDADPNLATPVKVYVGRTVTYISGTSLSSPLMLGVWARLESAHRNTLGLAPIALYRVYDKVNPGTSVPNAAGVPVVLPALNPKPVPGFSDITVGSNGLYQATPGWDYTTGLGAPDVKALVRSIQ